MTKFHIEPTSRCTLACPKCPRTIFKDQISNNDMSVENFKNFFNEEAFEMYPHKHFVFCGNHGDPIYHPRFLEMISHLKHHNRKIHIITNGAFRTVDWWKELSALLDEKDAISLSIDGLEDTNHLYRVNSKWNKLEPAFEGLQGAKCNVVWKYIVFKHNEHQIEEATSLAHSLGFKFMLHHSSRWQKDDPLKPDDQYVSPNLGTKIIENNGLVENYSEFEMSSQCAINREIYINSSGYLAPCCWSDNVNPVFKNDLLNSILTTYNIADISLKDYLENINIRSFKESTENPQTASPLCVQQCGRPCGAKDTRHRLQRENKPIV